MAAKRIANTKWPPSPTQVKPGETPGKPDLGGLYEENQRLRREKAQARKEAAARARELEARSEIAQRRNSFLRAGGGFLKGVLEGRTSEPPSWGPSVGPERRAAHGMIAAPQGGRRGAPA